MVNSAEEIMLTLDGRDNASQMFANVDKNAQSMASNISSAMSKVNTGLMSIGQVSDNLMQTLTGKSAMDVIFGTASKAETNKVLLKNMLEDVEKNYESFYDTVDKTTDSSLTSMQELIPALNALNAATGATDKELQNITPDVANFGASVLAQTGSVDQAQQAMMDLSKGYKGAFASLDQYGITEDSLKRAGYEEGDGIEKYMDAVTKVVGSTEELMETNQGLDALIGKSFSRAGKKIGNEFLPYLKDIKRGFIDLDNEMGGAIASSILMGTAGVEGANRWFWNITTTVQGVRDLKDAFGFLKTAIKGAGDAAEATSDAINTISNTSDIASSAAGFGGAAGTGAQVAKNAGKGEKALEGGMDALMLADLAKGNEKSRKDADKVLKDLKSLEKQQSRISDEMDYLQGYGSNFYYNKGIKYKPKSKSSSNPLNYFDDLLKDDSLKNGRKSLAEIQAARKDNFSAFDELIKMNQSERDKAGELIKDLSKIDDVKDEMQFSLDYAQSGFMDKLKMRKDKGVKWNVSDLFGSVKNFFKGGEEVADIVDEASDISKTLEGAEDIAVGMEAAAGAGEAATVAGPEMAAGAAGAETAAVGATSLSAAFTSMIVPLLALSATIMIMIPIVAVIAAEGMMFLKLLSEFMESLHFENVDLKGATKGISQIATALAWVGVAMAAMSFAGIMTGLAVITGGFLGILGPLDIAVNALTDAGKKLSEFNSVSIDPSVATTVQTIGETLGSIASTMGALTWSNIVTGISNFVADILGFSSVTEGLSQAKDDIIKASTILNEFSGITPLDESVASNIQNVCDSLASVGAAMDALRSIRDGQNWDDIFGELMEGLFGEGVDIQTALLNVKDDIIQASQALAQFTGISEIPEDVATKIKSVSDTLTSVNEAFTTLRGMRDDNNWDDWMDGLFGGTDIAGALETIKTDLITASQKLAELSGLSEISEDTGTKVQAVGDTLGKVSEVVSSLTSVPPMDDFDPATITTAVTNVQNAATELAKLNETTFDGASADTVLGSIQTTLQTVKDTLSAASGFTEPATSIGSQIVSGVQSSLSPLTSTVQGAVTSATDSAASSGWTGGSKIGTSTTNGMKSSLQIKSTMETEVGYALTAMTNKTQDFYDAGAALGKAANQGFQSQPAINPGSPGNLAHVMIDEVGYILDAMKSKYTAAKNMAAGLGQSIYQGFGSPTLDLDMFTNGGQLTAEHIGALQTVVSRAPDKADNRPVTIYIGEGAVTVDARNKTEQEARGILTLALESMDHITNVDVDGV